MAERCHAGLARALGLAGTGLASVARCCCPPGRVRGLLPPLTWLPGYTLGSLRMDLVAGLTVGLTVVPQSLAYAQVAGLPAQYGLYSAFMGCFVYCLLGTSKDVTLGPTAIMSLVVSVYVRRDPVYAVLLTFLSGAIQLLMGILRLGFLVEFISLPVLKGFTCAAAITIGFSQIKTLLGLKDIPQQFFQEVYYTFSRIAETRLADALLGGSSLLLLILLRVIAARSPIPPPIPVSVRISNSITSIFGTVRNAVVVLAAALVAFACESQRLHPFTLTGHIAQGLPPFHPPAFSETKEGTFIPFLQIVRDLGLALLVIPLLGFLESIAIAKAFATKNMYRIDPSQELIAIGLTNVLGSFTSSYPVTGSFGRTAVNSETGVATPAGGLVTGAVVLLSLAFLTPWFYFIPQAALSAIIICAVAPLFDCRILWRLWKIKKSDALVFVLTFALCLWEIPYGLLGGVVASLLPLLYPLLRPHLDATRAEAAVPASGALVVKLQCGLCFLAVEHLRDELLALQASCSVIPGPCSAPRPVVLDCRAVYMLDYSSVCVLRDLLLNFHSRGSHLLLACLQPQVLDVLCRSEVDCEPFASVAMAETWLSEQECKEERILH
ncbi:sodium-independent sulfate anion transporter-like [Petromyzon marinus]|uniref:Sodium-independent sulfate anion transporter n=1 Tax=Petromyzon marinus TaxID=7757 RepID=A0AAJ7TV29_PETMA|nr:sodium-independent sulfate anion transporter [Petromyzon marinus]XP_032823157.1 sodium-independent sulfate anion transporter [Petromyzon marinus]XP_032823159.1 sodium-independent sulfate anion transporter [Petromyzon marinus]